MGVPVKTEMDTLVLGTNPVGLPIYFDKNAYHADGIVLAITPVVRNIADPMTLPTTNRIADPRPMARTSSASG